MQTVANLYEVLEGDNLHARRQNDYFFVKLFYRKGKPSAKMSPVFEKRAIA